ncbi:MAG: extracellular solute-binding protein [Treponema sp.]|jgi:ABC-type glycerol-3-phosphate transport system substrate-binding protein|nr:extracellular solute-binding protein [Treponema sp.]
MRKYSVIIFSFFTFSCSVFESKTITIWTDRPEFAFYAQAFNTSQAEYKAEVRYFEFPSQQLLSSTERPDIVASSWLRSASTRTLFAPLDALFTQKVVDEAGFYPKLLEPGLIDGEQYLLPVSFNIPAMVFAQSNAVSSNFTIGLDEIKERGKAYNRMQRGDYTRMGFSPDWDDDFLFISAVLRNARFREGEPLSWDEEAMREALDYDRAWIAEANNGIQAADDFSFKYFSDTPAKRTAQGRVLFSYMDSAELFTMDSKVRAVLDFRWLSENDSIPLIEGSVYYGIYSGTKAQKGTVAFTKWFFQQETQRGLLEASRELQISETVFGVADGFSSLRNVTEDIFPRFYPNLLGHIPPDAFLAPSAILPHDWVQLKERVIVPFMHEYLKNEEPADIRSLDRRVSDWYRINK